MPSALRRLVPDLLTTADFRRFWIGQSVSLVGDQVTFFAMPLVAVLVLGADAAAMGFLTAAGLLPNLILAVPAGVWLDRVRSRRRVMIAADACRAVLIASVPLAWALGVLRIEHLFAVAIVAGGVAVVFDLAWNTLFVSIVPREAYVDASALLNGSRSFSSVLGPSVAGGLVQVLGAPVALLVDAISFLASAGSLRGVRAIESPLGPEESGLRERVLAGLAFLWRDPILRPTVVAAATLNLFNFGFIALFLLYATRILGVAPGVLGLVLGAGAVGGIIGAVIAARVGRRLGLGGAFALGCVLFPLPLVLVPLAAGPPAAILACLFAAEFGSGLGVMILDINVGAIILARTPDRIRGRAAGAMRLVNYGIRPIGAVIGGVLGQAIGVRPTLFVMTIGALLGVLWLVGSPVLHLRELPEASDGG